MKRKTGILTITLGFVTSIGYAEALPTNTDLKAAYCLGVSNALQGPLRAAKELGDHLPAEARVKNNSDIAAREEARQRLKLYLLPRVSGLELTGITLAIKSGENDLEKGGNEIGNCMASCKPSKENACEHACLDAGSPIKARLQSCNDVSWLPY